MQTSKNASFYEVPYISLYSSKSSCGIRVPQGVEYEVIDIPILIPWWRNISTGFIEHINS